MGSTQKPLLLVVADSNVPLDLAMGREDTLDAVEVIRRHLRGGRLLIPPRVIRELAFLSESAEEAHVRLAAANFFRQHRDWGCQLVNDVVLAAETVEEAALQIRKLGLLPASEINDSVILIEAAAMDASILLTTDEHLRGMDFLQLKLVLEEYGLSAPVIATPREIVRQFYR
jgi:predicted nucleic acid-binding protein